MICDGMAFVSADFMFQPHDDQENPSPNNIQTSCPPQDFHGVIQAQMRRSMSFSGVGSKGEEMQLGEDEMSDDGSQLGEKKRRLSVEQVKALEKSFELGNKLEPERKMQLARALGLQPRQIAIWFQNRRARWKTKQLEKDYDLLKRKFQALKADNDALLLHNKKLHAELLALKGRESSTAIGPINLNKETEGSWSNGSDETSCDFNLVTTAPAPAPLPADHSPLYSHQVSNNLIFHSSNGATTSVANHFLQSSSSRSSDHDLQSSRNKIDQMVPDESFCNMFTGVEDHQQGFWPWPEQQHFH